MAKFKAFKPNEQAERNFAKALRDVARHSAHVVATHVNGSDVVNASEMVKKLQDYARALGPWAARQSEKMLKSVAHKNKTAWQKNSKLIGRELQTGVAQADVGRMAMALMNEQVELIKSIPLKAAIRAQGLAQKAFYQGERADEIANELAATQDVSESDAVRIARTEVARSNTAITQARSMAVGSRQYIWRNSGDASVREAHKFYKGKKLDGVIFSWDNPPTLDDGTTGHPGTFPNCRCYPEPVFPKAD